MTIIRQKKNANTPTRWIAGLTIGVACATIGGIVFYNQAVNNNHEMAQRRNELRDMEVKNAELKSALYALTDMRTLQAFAADNGLIVEKDPIYTHRQDVSLNH